MPRRENNHPATLATATLATALDGTVIEARRQGSRECVAIQAHNDRQIVFDVRWAGEGWPQDVRTAAADVAESWPPNVVLIARRLSPGSIEWLRARGANWADATGETRIVGPDGLIVIRERARSRNEAGVGRVFAWSRSAIVTAEAILAHEDRTLRAGDLAAATGWSLPQTAKVLASFDAQDWTVKQGAARGRGAGRRLIDARSMLAAWSEAVADARRRSRLAHRAGADAMALLHDKLSPALGDPGDWAVSGWAALELLAPFATTTPNLHVYVADSHFAGPLSNAIEKAGLHEVDEGGRVIFWATDARVLRLASRAHGIPVVSAPRVYADLSRMGARGQDAADHIRERLIDPLHTGEPHAGDGDDE